MPGWCCLLLLLISASACTARASAATTASAPRPTCTVAHTPGADDSLSITAAITACNSNATILFSAGVQYNSFTPVQFALGQDVTVRILGNISLPADIAQVQAGVRSAAYRSGWFAVSSTGPGVRFAGPDKITGGGGGVVRSFGQAWWDAGQQTSRPLLFQWRASNGTIRGLTISKPIGKSFNIAGSGNWIEDVVVDAQSSSTAFPFNTDGFDVGGDGNTILNSQVSNGDDCVAIGSPCTNLHLKGLTCIGSHGISVAAKGGGSVNVANILVENVTLLDGLYGARYKSTSGNQGRASNIVYRNVVVRNITFPIYVTQNYFDQSQSPPPPSNLSVQIDGLTFQDFAGTINSLNPGDGSCISDPCWYHVAGADGTQSIIFDSLHAGSATNLSATGIAVVPDAPSERPTVMCNASVTPGDVGFRCWDGPYIPTYSS
ncbi:unnamed protein product [Mycena citricolor]|uniref:galacturonan 1,4-alpha-galacturonidase n=1 Tax=Mycena citricolor TaxID=2018698 RepID=A0AAD2Q0U4_9AGAR|nr:unnamed protein product [Mycena citricolor]